jgi:hypothetical protein
LHHADFERFLENTGSLPPPARLGTADANDAAALVDAHGEYVARCVYSRTWQHRQAGIRYLAMGCSGDASGGGGGEDVRGMLKYVTKGLRDPVGAVVAESVAALKGCAAAAPGRGCGAVVAAALPVLVERLGDSNARISVRSLHCSSDYS